MSISNSSSLHFTTSVRMLGTSSSGRDLTPKLRRPGGQAGAGIMPICQESGRVKGIGDQVGIGSVLSSTTISSQSSAMPRHDMSTTFL